MHTLHAVIKVLRLLFLSQVIWFLSPVGLCASPLCTMDLLPAGLLKKREPNWVPETSAVYENGVPQSILFLEPLAGSEEMEPVQLVRFYPSGALQEETDLTVLNGQAIPHGASVTYYPSCTLATISRYDLGHLNGLQETFYSNGGRNTSLTYLQGILEGKAKEWLPIYKFRSRNSTARCRSPKMKCDNGVK